MASSSYSEQNNPNNRANDGNQFNFVKEIKRLHHDMVIELSKQIGPSTPTFWSMFKEGLNTHLYPGEIESMNNMSDACSMLVTKNCIRHGEYDFLQKLFNRIEHMTCYKIVVEFSRKIEDMKLQSESTEEVIYERQTEAHPLSDSLSAKITIEDKDPPDRNEETIFQKIEKKYSNALDAIHIERLPPGEKLKLLKEWNETLKHTLETTKMLLALKEKHISASRAKRGCLNITFTCTESVMDLWNLYISGELTNILQNGLITKYVLEQCHCDYIKLAVFISKEDYIYCLKKQNDIKALLPVRPRTLAQAEHSISKSKDIHEEMSLVVAPTYNWQEYLVPVPTVMACLEELRFISTSPRSFGQHRYAENVRINEELLKRLRIVELQHKVDQIKMNETLSSEISPETRVMQCEQRITKLEEMEKKLKVHQRRLDDALSVIRSETRTMKCEERLKNLEEMEMQHNANQRVLEETLTGIQSNERAMKYDERLKRLEMTKLQQEVDMSLEHTISGATIHTNLSEEKTPILREAIQQWTTENIRGMLEKGFDPLEKGADGISGLEVALQEGQSDLLQLIARTICKNFTQYIRSIGIDIKSAFICYIPKEHETKININDVKIVVLLNKTPSVEIPKLFRELQICFRCKDSINKEEYPKVNLRNNDQHIKVRISAEEAEKLFQNHSNLQIVHPSLKFISPNDEIKIESCIALYCPMKGVIPLGESEFPKAIGDIKTDVREGFCQLASDEIRPGTKINCRSIKSSATIGGFVEVHGENFFITAAHACVNKDILQYDGEMQKGFFQKSEINISRDSYPHDSLGKVRRWQYECNKLNDISIDAALVKLKWDVVLDGLTIPDENTVLLDETQMLKLSQSDTTEASVSRATNVDDLPVRCTNRVLTLEEIRKFLYCNVIKEGGKTGFTVGMLDTDTFCKTDQEVIMCQQITIVERSNGRFCERGDSGSFCFLVEVKESEIVLRPFAMIIAVETKTGNAISTPLIRVFERFGLDANRSILEHPITRKGVQQDNLSKQLRTFKSDISDIKDELKYLKKNIGTNVQNINKHMMKEIEALLDRKLQHNNAVMTEHITTLFKQISSERKGHDNSSLNLTESANTNETEESNKQKHQAARQLNTTNEQPNGEEQKGISDRERYVVEQINTKSKQPDGEGRNDFRNRESHAAEQLNAETKQANEQE